MQNFRNQLNNIFFILFLFFFTLSAKAQFPVQVVPQLISPASLNLTEYYTGTIPKLTVTLTNRDLLQPSIRVKLRVSISNNSISLTSDVSKNYIPVTLEPGIPMRLSGLDLAQFLNPDNLMFQGLTKQAYLQTGKLPEGLYNFCFEAIDATTNRVLSQSNACALAWISLSEPPLLNLPFNRAEIIAKNPTFINFNWTPRHQNSANNAINTSYEFEMVELLDNKVDPNAGFTSSRIFYKTILNSSSLLYGPAQPTLIIGKRYAWRVRAMAADKTKEYDEFRNNGYSPIYSFSYLPNLPKLEIENIEFKGNDVVIKWTENKNFYGNYLVSFYKDNDRLVPFYTANVKENNFSGNFREDNSKEEKIYVKVSYFLDGSTLEAGKTVEAPVGNGPGNIKVTNPPDNKIPVEDVIIIETPASKALASKTVVLRGVVQWAYFNSDDTRKTNFKASSNQTANSNKNSLLEESRPALTPSSKPIAFAGLEGAILKVYSIKNGVKTLLETTSCNSSGAYASKIIKEENTTLEIEVNHPSGYFSTQKIEPVLVVNSNSKESKYISKNNFMLIAKNLELNLTLAFNKPAEANIEILQEKASWDRSYGKISGLNSASQSGLIQYNGLSYVVVSKLLDGQTLPKLLINQSNTKNYLLRYSIPNGQTFFAELPKTEKEEIIKLNWVIEQTNLLQLKLTIGNEIAKYNTVFLLYEAEKLNASSSIKGVSLSESSKPVGFPISNANLSNGFNAIYELSGKANIFNGEDKISIPILTKGAKYRIVATSSISQNQWFSKDIEATEKSSYTVNMDLSPEVFSYVGRVTDANNKPIENCLVTVDNSNETIRTSANGFYIISGEFNKSNTILITADGYEGQKIKIADLSNILKLQKQPVGEDGILEASQLWETGITGLSTVKKFKDNNNQTAIDANLFNGNKGFDPLASLYEEQRENNLVKIAGILEAGTTTIIQKEGFVYIKIEVEGKPFPGIIDIYKDEVLIKTLEIKNAGDSVLFKSIPGFYDLKVRPLDNATEKFKPIERDLEISFIQKLFKKHRNVKEEDIIVPEPILLASSSNYLPRLVNKTEDYKSFMELQTNYFLVANSSNEPTVIVRPQPAFSVTFIVKNKSDGKNLSEVTVKSEVISSIPKTDANGKCVFNYPASNYSTLKITFTKNNFKTVEQRYKVEDIKGKTFTIELDPFKTAPIKTISGFKVEITSQVPEPSKPDHARVSGKMEVVNNGIYSTYANKNKLEFRNIVVKIINNNGDAEAIEDINFENASYAVKAFENTPVEVQNIHLTKATGKNDYSKAVLRGVRVKTVFGGVTNANSSVNSILRGFSYDALFMQSSAGILNTNNKYKNVSVTSPTGGQLTSLITVFEPLGLNDNSLKPDRNYDLYFESAGSKPIKVKTVGDAEITMSKIGNKISAQGLDLDAVFQIPMTISKIADNNGKIKLSKFRIRKDLSAVDLVFDVSESKAFNMQLQKVQSQITKVTLTGLGSVNCGVGFGGRVWLTKNPPNSEKSKKGVLTIKTLSFVNKPSGVTLAGQFQLPSEGISVQGLTFKTGSGQTLGFSYNISQTTFEFNAAGNLTYTGTGKNPALNKVFPLGVDFRLKTQNWAMLIVANVNKQIDFGVVKVNIGSLLVNVGYNVTTGQMSEMMKFYTAKGPQPNAPNITGPTIFNSGGETELVDEGRTSWAIGIAGGIEMPIKSLKMKTEAKVVLAMVNNNISLAINELGIEVENAAFTLKAQVKMEFNDTRSGLEGVGEIKVLGNGLSAAFKFYKYSSGGIELGAAISVSTKAGIVTGPIAWLSIGGGFNFNTNANIYEVWLTGDITNAGGTRDAMYVNIERLGILFETNTCGAKPAIDGRGNLFIKNERWLTIKVKADFCRMLVMLDINGQIPTLKSLAKVTARGTVFAAAAYQGDPACLLIKLSATMYSSFVNGNIDLALGINFDQNRRNLPIELYGILNSIDWDVKERNGSYLNAIYLGAQLSVPSGGKSFSVGLGSLKLMSFNYNYYGNANGYFFYKFTNNEFKLKLGLKAGVNGSVSILGSSLNGNAAISANVVGGYNGSWYVSGDVGANVTVWFGNIGCNDFRFKRSCSKFTWLCGCGWFCVKTCRKEVCIVNVFGIDAAKICLGARASFSYSQSSGTSFSLRKN